MPQASYQVNYDARTDTATAFDTLNQVAQNGVGYFGQGAVVGVQYVNAQGRLRITLSDPLPQIEVDSFQGAITAL